jgi:uncharacterized membrane protein YraQ (UPF0718 family)
MTKNVGDNDATARTVAAIVLILVALLLVENPYLRIVLALISAVLAGTAFVRSCPMYSLLGMDTRTKETQESTPGSDGDSTGGENRA